MIQFYHFCLRGCQRVTPTRLQVSRGAMRRRQTGRRRHGRVPSDLGKDAQNQREHHEEDDEANLFLWLAHVEEVGR